MYKIGKPRPRWKRRIAAFFIICVLAISGVSGLFYWLNQTTKHATKVESGTGSTRKYNPDQTKQKLVVQEPQFTFELPGDWKESKRNEDPRYTSIEWQMGAKPQNRWLKIYTDRFPADLPVNRLMPVTIGGTRILPASPSDNCANFTDAGNKNASVKVVKAMAKWNNVSFMCELDNIYNNVAAAGSQETGTALEITGSSQQRHRYLILYTDHSIPSDDSPFREALESFVAK